MRRCTAPVAWLLVLTLAFVLLTPRQTATATNEQVRLIDPSGRARNTNAKKLQLEVRELNKAVAEYNQLLIEARYYEDTDPDKAAPLAEKIAGHWERIARIWKHLDEADTSR